MAAITLPALGEHIIFCGTTGSGKSYLAQEMLAHYERVFVFDTQDSLAIPGAVKIIDPVHITRKLRAFAKIRYVPKLEFRTKGDFNYILKVLMTNPHAHKRIIYIDEIYHLGFGPSFPDWLSRGISTARHKGISVWTASQRPANIPLAVMTEARRIYLFYLSYAEDVKKIAKFTRDEKNFLEEVENLKYDYSMIELDRVTGRWRKLQPLQKNEGGNN